MTLKLNQLLSTYFRHFEAQETKSLRVGVNSFFDHLALVVKTIQQFDPRRSDPDLGGGDTAS